jgi:hypothetical protein
MHFSFSTADAAREENGVTSEALEEFQVREQVLLLSCWYFFIESARHRSGSKVGKLMRTAMCKWNLAELSSFSTDLV